MNRKNFIFSIAATAASSAFAPALAAAAGAVKRPGAYPRTPPFTASNAPDVASRTILGRPAIRRLAGNADRGGLVAKMQNQFARVVEQNFSRVNPRIADLLIRDLSDQELEAFGQLYTNSVATSGLPGLLPDVLAHRLEGKELYRVAKFFGTSTIQDSLLRVAPHKANRFERELRSRNLAPTAGAPLRVTEMPGLNVGTSAGIGPFFYYTPEEIYLSFRTAPIGALGIVPSIYETSLVLGQASSVAFGAGWAIGTGLGHLIQWQLPDLWDAIGGTIDMMIENIFGPRSEGPGPAEEAMAVAFDIPPGIMNLFAETGGDYMVAEAWQDYSGGWGGGGSCQDCSLI